MKPFKVKVRENSNSFKWVFVWARDEATALKRARARYKKKIRLLFYRFVRRLSANRANLSRRWRETQNYIEGGTVSYKQLLESAASAGACKDHLSIARQYTSFEEALKDPQAPYWAYWYARDVIKGRWTEGEAVIATNAHWAYWYALTVIKGRWAEGEAVIATNAHWAYYYARDVIKGRWPEGEAVIATNVVRARHYARDVIKGRWPEGDTVNSEAAQAKLADLERQVKELKEQLAAQGHWVPKLKEHYLHVDLLGRVVEDRNDGTEHDKFLIANGNAYSVTPEGRAAAENAAFLIGFRARWRRSADVLPGSWCWLPVKSLKLRYVRYAAADGLPGWSTQEKCRAFVDSEGGPERFAEILERGIL